MPRYLYGMRHLRGFGPGCQPARGLISREDDPAGRYNDVLVYDRELEPHEIDDYELDFMGVEPDTTTDGSSTVKKGGNDEDRTTYGCISRRASLEKIRTMQTYKLFEGDDMILIDKAQVQTELMMLPSVQQERPRGHWVETGDEPYDEWECDVCGFAIDGSGCIDPEEYRDVYKFCPNCGADMRGEQE